ncbi:MAG TPA: hypothetical protein VF070_02525 [Streptosporangiaceae bacterium]
MRVIKPRRHGTGTGITVLVTAGLIAASAILAPNLVTHHADLHIREADSATTYSNTVAPSPTALAPSMSTSTSSSEDPPASADGVPPGDSVTILNVTEVAAPEGAAALGCRAEVAPALLMNSFVPQGG